MSENLTPYHTGTGPAAVSHDATEYFVARAHTHRQGIPYEDRDILFARLPERLRALADLVLGGKMPTEDIAYALAALIDSIEHAPGSRGPNS